MVGTWRVYLKGNGNPLSPGGMDCKYVRPSNQLKLDKQIQTKAHMYIHIIDLILIIYLHG